MPEIHLHSGGELSLALNFGGEKSLHSGKDGTLFSAFISSFLFIFPSFFLVLSKKFPTFQLFFGYQNYVYLLRNVLHLDVFMFPRSFT